ncbi:PE family protein [Mycobacterium haemophilum]|uniref:PE family protein n=1 Tax=Mycobacterium haemophilum TaxID=29311 RepID=UPI0034D4E4B1
MQASPDSMTGISTKMVEIAHQVSIANAQKAPAMTKIPAPGKDSVSALLARFFNAVPGAYRSRRGHRRAVLLEPKGCRNCL